jgi:hypothetical protein
VPDFDASPPASAADVKAAPSRPRARGPGPGSWQDPVARAGHCSASHRRIRSKGPGRRPPAAGPEPQPQAVPLLVPRTDPEVAVDPAGGLMIDPGRPVAAALAADMNLPAVQVQVAAVRITGVVANPGQLGQPVARNTAMIAVSRRWANVRPAHACSSFVSSPVVKTGTSFSVTRGGCSLSSGRAARLRRPAILLV